MERIEFHTELRRGSLRTRDHVWNAAVYPHKGHGMMSVVGRGAVQVHRIAWEELIGPIPPGFDLHHECDEVACWWPELVDFPRLGHGPGDLEPIGQHDQFTFKLTPVLKQDEHDPAVLREHRRVDHAGDRRRGARYGLSIAPRRGARLWYRPPP
jgi:hypothetical protein